MKRKAWVAKTSQTMFGGACSRFVHVMWIMKKSMEEVRLVCSHLVLLPLTMSISLDLCLNGTTASQSIIS